MSAIYRKTDKGRTEVRTREHRLAPRVRSALIMIDGQHDDTDFAKLLPEVDEVLDTLLEHGFIERVDVPTRPAPLAPASPAKPVAPVIAARGDDFASRRREAVRTLTDAVGPVGEALAIQIEKATEEKTLRPLLVLARDSIRNIRGATAADAFTARFLT